MGKMNVLPALIRFRRPGRRRGRESMSLRNVMKVLITGGAGYIGSILSEQLLARGDKVHVVDSLVHGDHCLFQLCANRDFEFTRGDVRDREMVLRAAKDADVIIPLAAL